MLARLPEWMDAEFLERAAAVLIFVLAALAIFTMITVRSLGTRLVVIVLLGLGVFGLYQYRVSVEDCEETCDCSLLGEDVPMDDCGITAAPASDRP